MLGLFQGRILGGLSFLSYGGIGDEVSLRTGLQLDGSPGSSLVPPCTFLGTFRNHILVEGVLMRNIAFYSVGIMQNNVA